MKPQLININNLKVGDLKEFQIVITHDKHINFKETIGDTSPVHNDDNFAISAGFKKKIAYGFYVISYFSRLYGNYLPGGSSICLSQSVKFLKPVYIGEKITVRGTITHINTNLKILYIKNEVINQKGEVCVNGNGVVKIVI